jgi:hypothetical protein
MVLPFENDGGDPAQNIYAKGTTEAVIGALILFKNILVLDADTSFRFPTQQFSFWPVGGSGRPLRSGCGDDCEQEIVPGLEDEVDGDGS